MKEFEDASFSEMQKIIAVLEAHNMNYPDLIKQTKTVILQNEKLMSRLEEKIEEVEELKKELIAPLSPFLTKKFFTKMMGIEMLENANYPTVLASIKKIIDEKIDEIESVMMGEIYSISNRLEAIEKMLTE